MVLSAPIEVHSAHFSSVEGGGDHGGAQRFGNLDGGGSHPGGAQHQHGLACLELRPVHQRMVGRGGS